MPQENKGSYRSINVVLQMKDINGEVYNFDINEQSLIDMTFNRYLGNTKNIHSGVLSNVNLTMFDKTGYKLLSLFQSNEGKLRIKYGFEDDLSETFDLNILKYNATFNNLGCIASIGAIGREINNKFGPEVYKEGAKIKDILIRMAKRNYWDIGDDYENIDVEEVSLPRPLYLEQDESDAEFIYKKILPICNRTVVNSSMVETEYWDVKLFNVGDKTKFFFKKYSNWSPDVRVWEYFYGASSESNVISLTNHIDYTFLIRGLSVEVPADPSEYVTQTEEQLEETYNNIVFEKWGIIEAMLKGANLPVPKKDEFALQIEFVEMEEAGDELLEYRVFDAIQNELMAINTIDLEVVGNHKIRPTDIIDLTVRNRGAPDSDGSYDNIATGHWKVVRIEENIGIKGFTTKLNLVREASVINYDDYYDE